MTSNSIDNSSKSTLAASSLDSSTDVSLSSDASVYQHSKNKSVRQEVNQGFILTRQSQDRFGRTCITLWLKTATGAVKLEVLDELSVFFVTQLQQDEAIKVLNDASIKVEKVSPLQLKTFTQEPVTGIYFKSMRDFYAARDRLKHHKIKCYEDDFRPDDRFLMERFITANLSFIGMEKANFQITSDQTNTTNYKAYSKAKCKALPYHQADKNIALTMVSVDLECSMQGELYSIGLYAKENGEDINCVFMIGEPEETELEYIHWVESESALLSAFIEWIRVYDPDIMIGWNVINFDFSLFQKRCDLLGIKLSIGRDGSEPYWRENTNSDQKFIEIAGRVVLDGIDLLKTATYNFPSFSLENVSNTLLNTGKKVKDVDNRVQEITDNFHNNKQDLAIYNLEDCRLVWLIFEKTQLLEFAILRAQLTGLPIDRIGGSVAAFTNLYLPKLHRSGYVAPNMGDGESGLVSPGGFVMDSLPGLYDNVLVLDYKSLYPSIIRTFNVDPMGLIEGLEDDKHQRNNPIKGFDGAYFSREKHFLPDIIQSLWLERDKAKIDKNAALSQAIKIIMNSFYGILGSTGCRFFDPRLAGSITKRSHELLKITSKWIETEGYKVIYGDTDSIFVHVGSDKTQEQCLVLGKELQKLINTKMDHLLLNVHGVHSELEIEFETHFSKFLMPTIRGLDVGTKKRYAGMILVRDKETGVERQQMVYKGLETVRTDWTELAKEFQQALYLKVFNDEPTSEYILDIVERTLAGEFDDKLIYRKRIRRRLNEYVKNVPPHVKAARLADMINQEQGKPLRYQNKGWIEYYITLNGPQAKEYLTAPLDYQFYIDRQLEAVADGILPFVGSSFNEVTNKQMGLF
ncbi:DNA polymerase II [Pseudocolwellia agarivorans]|uniref:DNA polymerase II n=1 Tax=Pseudocolwellia agarivorans TaxID=1911682 RepID=UPI003F884250